MPQPLTARYVLLVLDDEVGPVAALVGGAVADLGLEADVVACACPDEAVVRLRVGRRYSAVIAGPDHPGFQTVTSASARAATPVVVVDPGATAARLAQVIRSRAAPVGRRDRLPGSGWASRSGSAQLVAVCGPGGTGASVLAAALAADLARRLSQPDVVLADFALHSDQAVLHGLAEPLPSLLDLLEASRLRLPSPAQLRQVSVAGPGYRLLPGLRRLSHWTAVTARVFETALCGLRAACGLVVADIAGEFEGEAETGSLDVEDRNHMARHIARQADLVAVVGRPGMSGERRLSLTIDAMLD
ncbi:MAG: hypothetical protein M3N98_10480, partial [Actinomycetota bacterium]|nr:hypothetical protein [Actinomycetota bacterium]